MSKINSTFLSCIDCITLSKYLNILPSLLPSMERTYWITKKRVICPLPAPIREQLQDKGVEFENNGIADYKVVGKKVVIDFKKKEKKSDD